MRLVAVLAVLGAVLAVVGFTLIGSHGGGGVQGWDDSVGTWFQTHRFHLVGASKVIAFLGDAPNLAVLVAAGTIVLLLVGQRVRAFIPLAAYLGAEFLVFLTRTYIHRPRPLSANYPGPGSLPGIHETSWSFPSGHATAGTAVVVSLAGLAVLTWKVRWPWIVGIVVGAMVATSRLVLGVHWWSDVTFGLVAGVVWGITVTLALADLPWPFSWPARRLPVQPSAEPLSQSSGSLDDGGVRPTSAASNDAGPGPIPDDGKR